MAKVIGVPFDAFVVVLPPKSGFFDSPRQPDVPVKSRVQPCRSCPPRSYADEVGQSHGTSPLLFIRMKFDRRADATGSCGGTKRVCFRSCDILAKIRNNTLDPTHHRPAAGQRLCKAAQSASGSRERIATSN